MDAMYSTKKGKEITSNGADHYDKQDLRWDKECLFCEKLFSCIGKDKTGTLCNAYVERGEQ